MKKLLALLLVAAMCLMLLCACGASNSDTPAADEAEPNTPAEDNTPADTTDPGDDTTEAPEPDEDEEPEFEDEEISVYLMFTNSLEDIENVEAAINKISSERYGISVDLHGFNMGEYATQLSLAITSGEQVDLACMSPIPGSTFASVTSSGQAMDISGLIDTYCPDIKAVMGDYIKAFQIGDALYGLPVARQKASNMYYRYRSDIAEELGLVDMIENAPNFDAMDEVFAKVKSETDLNPLGGNRNLNGHASCFWNLDSFSTTPFDTVGDNLYLLYGDTEGKVKCLYENENY